METLPHQRTIVPQSPCDTVGQPFFFVLPLSVLHPSELGNGRAINQRMSIAWGKTVVAVLRLGRLHLLVAGLSLFAFGSRTDILAGSRSSAHGLPFGHPVFLPTRLDASFTNDHVDPEADRCGKPLSAAKRLESR